MRMWSTQTPHTLLVGGVNGHNHYGKLSGVSNNPDICKYYTPIFPLLFIHPTKCVLQNMCTRMFTAALLVRAKNLEELKYQSITDIDVFSVFAIPNSSENKQTITIHRHMKEHHKHNVKRKKPDTKDHMDHRLYNRKFKGGQATLWC